jgi:hypothetical protein
VRVVAWDTETALFRAGVQAPELVCLTWQRSTVKSWLQGGDLMAKLDGVRGAVYIIQSSEGGFS